MRGRSTASAAGPSGSSVSAASRAPSPTKAAPLGFRVVTTDPFVPDEAVRDAGAEPATLQELLAAADVVSIHAPLTSDSRHLIGAAELAMMKPGAILVNTSRGPLVDLDALRAALAEDRLGGAGLDVLEVEPPDADDPLLHRDDVIVTPHAAFYSEESLESSSARRSSR